MSSSLIFSKRTQGLSDPPINWLIQYQLEHPQVISLAAGLVDYPTLPGEILKEIFPKVLTSENYQKNLQYGTTQGNPQLREEIAKLYNRQENIPGDSLDIYNAEASHCVVTNGSQQLLFLLADCLLNPGDIILVEAPTYFVFTAVLETFNVQCISISMDEDGMIPDDLNNILTQLESKHELHKVKCLYTVDYFQNPSGRSLCRSRKKEVFDIIEKFNEKTPLLIIEDAAYRDLGFSPNVSDNSIKSHDINNKLVAYTSTFSKSFCPGLKLGYGFLPYPLLEKLVRHKGNHDFGTSNLNQMLILEALRLGYYQTQVEKLRNNYKEKADVMERALRKHMPKEVQFESPKGGIYFWLKFPAMVETGPSSPLFAECLKNNLLYVPGEYCYAPDSTLGTKQGLNEMRLSYGTASKDEIAEGIKRLAIASRKILNSNS